MPNHFTTIGFPIHDEASYRHYAELALEYGARFDTPGGAYVRWRAGEGAELWVQLEAGDRVVGMSPHFASRARRRVAIARVVRRAGENAMEGAMEAWANPTSESPESGDCQLLFDLPDFDRVAALPLPATADAQLAAFAQTLDVYATDHEFSAAQTERPGYGAESFVPVGLLWPNGGDRAAAPTAEALLAGHVCEAELRTNPVAGARFWWARVRSYGGEFDLVADPALVPGGLPVGGVVHGRCWLSGRLPDVTPVERPKRTAWRWVSKA